MEFPENLRHIIRENEPLAPFCWLRTGGPAKYFAEPNSLADFCNLIAFAMAKSIPVRLLGDGSNIVVRDEGVDGLVIRLATADLCQISIAENRLTARAGARLNHVISAAAGAGLGGLEHLAGIPGTVGAAVVTNAGVTNDDIGSRVSCVQTIDRHGQLAQRDRQDLQFGFRRSSLEDAYVAEVELTLEPIDASELTRRMQSSWIVRRAAQPPSGQRVVQALIEPNGVDLAELLDAVDMRGVRQGDVSLSSQFPGFLVATGDAKSSDVLALLSQISRTVEAKTGTQLQPQLKIW
ncbi:MAG: FAD-binding protein [Pirellulaceae bacterium]